MGRSDPGDQNMLKNQSAWNCSKMDTCIDLILMIPTQLEQAQTDIVCRDIVFCPLCQIGKIFPDCTVCTICTCHVAADRTVCMDLAANVARLGRLLAWQGDWASELASFEMDLSGDDTCHQVDKWEGATWPNQGPSHGTPLLVLVKSCLDSTGFEPTTSKHGKCLGKGWATSPPTISH
jgi:hypothetical protein